MIQGFRQSFGSALVMALLVISCYQSPAPDALMKDDPSPQGANLSPAQKSIVVDKARLFASAKAGGDYLLRMQYSDGSFQYSYDPKTDEFNNRTYNILRHAGTAVALFQLFEATGDRQYLESANLALRFLRTRLRPAARVANASYVLDFDGKAKLGANGLALMAFGKQLALDPKNGNRQEAQRLANLILALQHQDGSFASYHPVRGDEPEGNVSLYYPGEAILGLVHLYAIDPDKRWLASAQRGADFLVAAQRRMSQLPPDAWLMQALEALNKIKSQPQYRDHAIALGESLIASQYTEEDSAEYAGGFAPGVPRATPAASRSEGILAAYRLARAANDKRAARLAGALKRAARFLLSQQFGDQNPHPLPNPQRALGGFRESADVLRIRIDYVQHNISALLGVAESLY
jgi:hypothetical protein